MTWYKSVDFHLEMKLGVVLQISKISQFSSLPEHFLKKSKTVEINLTSPSPTSKHPIFNSASIQVSEIRFLSLKD